MKTVPVNDLGGMKQLVIRIEDRAGRANLDRCSCLSGICTFISVSYSTIPRQKHPYALNFLQFLKNVINVYKAYRPRFSGRTKYPLAHICIPQYRFPNCF